MTDRRTNTYLSREPQASVEKQSGAYDETALLQRVHEEAETTSTNATVKIILIAALVVIGISLITGLIALTVRRARGSALKRKQAQQAKKPKPGQDEPKQATPSNKVTTNDTVKQKSPIESSPFMALENSKLHPQSSNVIEVHDREGFIRLLQNPKDLPPTVIMVHMLGCGGCEAAKPRFIEAANSSPETPFVMFDIGIVRRAMMRAAPANLIGKSLNTMTPEEKQQFQQHASKFFGPFGAVVKSSSVPNIFGVGPNVGGGFQQYKGRRTKEYFQTFARQLLEE